MKNKKNEILKLRHSFNLLNMSYRNSPLPKIQRSLSLNVLTPTPPAPVLSNKSSEQEYTYKSTLLMESTTIRTSVMLTCLLYRVDEFINTFEHRSYFVFVFKQPDDHLIQILDNDSLCLVFETTKLTKATENPTNNLMKRKMSLSNLNNPFTSYRQIYEFVINKILNSTMKNNIVTLTLNPIIEDLKVNHLLLNSEFTKTLTDLYQFANQRETRADFNLRLGALSQSLAEVKGLNRDIKRQMAVVNIFLSLKRQTPEEKLKKALCVLVRRWRSRKIMRLNSI